jgi:F0F1-type ATP synthase membrane subunit b/b'
MDIHKLLTPSLLYLISFIIFGGIVYYYLYPQVIKGIDLYIKDIKNQLQHAEKIHKEAKTQLAESQSNHTEATLKADKILKEAKNEGKKMDFLYKKELYEYEERQTKLGEEKVIRLERTINEDIKNKIIEKMMKKSVQLFSPHIKRRERK